MSFKKLLLIVLLLFVVGSFVAVSFSSVQAAKRPAPGPIFVNNPPECYPINYPVGGYWSMACIDHENNISSAVLRTNGVSNLVWDNTYVEMIVELNRSTVIYWQVCDSAGACVDGRYP